MSRIIIHIGLHKTGSTTIQTTLGANRHLLRRQGVAYPKFEDHFFQHGMASPWIGLPSQYVFQADPVAYWRDLRETCADAHTVVISSEELSRRQPYPVDYAALADYVAAFEEKKIVVVFKHQADYLQSIYGEIFRATPQAPFVDWLRESLRSGYASGLLLDYGILYAELLRGFTDREIQCLNFNELAAAGAHFANRFIALIALGPDSAAIHPEVENTSRDALACLIAGEALRHAVPTRDDVAVARRQIDARFGPETKTTVFTRQEFASVCALYQQRNAALEQRIRQNNPEFLFPQSRIRDDAIYREDITADFLRETQNAILQNRAASTA